MVTRTNDPNDGRSISYPEQVDYDRYSHVATDAADIIYDTERDSAWIQATSSVRLEEWR